MAPFAQWRDINVARETFNKPRCAGGRVDANTALLGIGAIITFGFFAEFVFKKTGIPDVLLLVLLGFLIGPGRIGLAGPAPLAAAAPPFPTSPLLCLVFDGALSIDL